MCFKLAAWGIGAFFSRGSIGLTASALTVSIAAIHFTNSWIHGLLLLGYIWVVIIAAYDKKLPVRYESNTPASFTQLMRPLLKDNPYAKLKPHDALKALGVERDELGCSFLKEKPSLLNPGNILPILLVGNWQVNNYDVSKSEELGARISKCFNQAAANALANQTGTNAEFEAIIGILKEFSRTIMGPEDLRMQLIGILVSRSVAEAIWNNVDVREEYITNIGHLRSYWMRILFYRIMLASLDHADSSLKSLRYDTMIMLEDAQRKYERRMFEIMKNIYSICPPLLSGIAVEYIYVKNKSDAGLSGIRTTKAKISLTADQRIFIISFIASECGHTVMTKTVFMYPTDAIMHRFLKVKALGLVSSESHHCWCNLSITAAMLMNHVERMSDQNLIMLFQDIFSKWGADWNCNEYNQPASKRLNTWIDALARENHSVALDTYSAMFVSSFGVEPTYPLSSTQNEESELQVPSTARSSSN